jgi:hypothetical protein
VKQQENTMELTYPYLAWTLMPSFKPVQIELVKHYESFSNDYGDVSATGKRVYRADIFPTKEAAIAEGWKRIASQEADLAKLAANVEKKKAALRKAE